MLDTEQNRLKQNWTFLKTRLVDIGSILDRLYQYDVLSLDQIGHLRNIHNGQVQYSPNNISRYISLTLVSSLTYQAVMDPSKYQSPYTV